MQEYEDCSLNATERAKALLKDMSAQEKIAQLQGFIAWEPEQEGLLTKMFPLGVGNISCLQMRCMETLDECVDFQYRMQKEVTEHSPHHIPAIFHMEGLCGAYVPGAKSFPSGIGRASSFDPELEEKIGKIVGRQERAVGITHTLAPVLDINRDPRMGRIGETYGEDAELASQMGTAYVRGCQGSSGGRQTECVAKHFLGFHRSNGGIHSADCEISERSLREVYGKPFASAIKYANLRGVMPCYNVINGVPASESREILTGLLREEMSFDGVCVSDYSALEHLADVQKTAGSYSEAGSRSLSAGMDMELPMGKCFNDELIGLLDADVIDTAVLRVLTAKFRMGLFENPYADLSDYYNSTDEDTVLKSAQESLVLLKNDGILPLKNNIKRIVVIGCHASSARYFFGGYTHFSMAEGMLAARSTMAGIYGKDEGNDILYLAGTTVETDGDPKYETLLKKLYPNIKSLYEEIRDRFPSAVVTYEYGYPYAGNDGSGFESALKKAENADLAVLTLGGKHGTSSIASTGEGIDSTNINLPKCQELFIEKLANLSIPAIGVHFDGRPISSDNADKYLSAILEAWNPSEYAAKAIAQVLLGEYNPSGKLPVSVAFHAGQLPVYYNHLNGSQTHQGESIGFPDYVDCPHKPRYAFGFGLSYAEFEYSDLRVDGGEISFVVLNTGECEGTEIAQVYFTDLVASVVRPCLELYDFERVTLAPGENKRLNFPIEWEKFAFLGRDMNWRVEAGDFEIKVGAASEDIRLSETLTLEKDKERRLLSMSGLTSLKHKKIVFGQSRRGSN